MKITKISVDLTEHTINGVILLLILISFFTYILYGVIFKKIDALTFLVFSLLFLWVFIFLAFSLKNICDTKESHKYTIYYNFKDLPKEMTTKEIIDEIMKKDFFDNEIDEISVLTITIPSGDFNDMFLQHINQMEEKTQKKKTKNFLKIKFIN